MKIVIYLHPSLPVVGRPFKGLPVDFQKECLNLFENHFKLLAVSLFLLMGIGESAAAEVGVETNTKANHPASLVSVTKNDSNTFPALTLVPSGSKPIVKLIAPDGTELHHWDVFAIRARLTPRCTLLVVHDGDVADQGLARTQRKTVAEYDWQGNALWSYQAPRKVHHDIHELENGNLLFPMAIQHTVHVESDSFARKVRSDKVVELSKSRQEVWSWHAHDHLDVHSCGLRECIHPLEDTRWKRMAKDWSHVNTVAPLPQNRWAEAGDKRFSSGNVVILPRNLWKFLVVDKASGRPVYEYGATDDELLIKPHEAHMIAPDLPGAGNFLVFDNGNSERPFSIVKEINPQTKKVVWSFQDPERFYSEAKGSIQRLPNGNTFISSGAQGLLLEVNREGSVVWEATIEGGANRAARYESSYCGELGKLADKSQ